MILQITCLFIPTESLSLSLSLSPPPPGMFDRETSRHVVLHPKLTTFDISALPEDGPATSMVMVVANAWLMGMLTHERGWRTNFIAEEGWHLLGGPGGKVIRSKSKLSRGLGVSIVAAIHHISDIPPTSEAIAMIKEAQTIHLFRAGTRRRHRRLRPVLQPRGVQRRRPRRPPPRRPPAEGRHPQGDPRPPPPHRPRGTLHRNGFRHAPPRHRRDSGVGDADVPA